MCVTAEDLKTNKKKLNFFGPERVTKKQLNYIYQVVTESGVALDGE